MKKTVYLFLTAMMISALFCMPATAEESSPHNLSGTVIFGTNCDVSYHFGHSEEDWFEEYYGEDVAKDQAVFTISYTF